MRVKVRYPRKFVLDIECDDLECPLGLSSLTLYIDGDRFSACPEERLPFCPSCREPVIIHAIHPGEYVIPPLLSKRGVVDDIKFSPLH